MLGTDQKLPSFFQCNFMLDFDERTVISKRFNHQVLAFRFRVGGCCSQATMKISVSNGIPNVQKPVKLFGLQRRTLYAHRHLLQEFQFVGERSYRVVKHQVVYEIVPLWGC